MRPKASETSSSTDVWAGNVHAIVKRVDALEEGKLSEIEDKFGAVDQKLAEVKTEMNEVKTEVNQVRSELNEVRSELKSELSDVKTEMDKHFATILSALEVLKAES